MRGWSWGGSEELWSQAATEFRRAGHEVRALIEYKPVPSERTFALREIGIEVETYPAPGYLVGTTRRVWERISLGTRRALASVQRFNPDLVVISQGDNSGGFDWAETCRKSAIPYVIIVQCNNDLTWFSDQSLEAASCSYLGASRVFCVSRNNLEMLRLQIGNALENGEVVWNPYSGATQTPPPWPDDSKSHRLACVARMDLAAKGQDILLQVLARPEWKGRPVEVSFFGTGVHESAVRRIAEMLQIQNVSFHGHVSDITKIWEHNHMLLLPSRYEGLPLTLVEAMWCARPAVVTDVGGNTEVCAHGETGFVAPSATLKSFADTLEQAWQRRAEWQRLGQSARARAEALVPKDPIGKFCERLLACVPKAQQAPVI